MHPYFIFKDLVTIFFFLPSVIDNSFLLSLFIVPVIGLAENTLFDIATDSQKKRLTPASLALQARQASNRLRRSACCLTFG